jgi:hypothetical protein
MPMWTRIELLYTARTWSWLRFPARGTSERGNPPRGVRHQDKASGSTSPLMRCFAVRMLPRQQVLFQDG